MVRASEHEAEQSLRAVPQGSHRRRHKSASNEVTTDSRTPTLLERTLGANEMTYGALLVGLLIVMIGALRLNPAPMADIIFVALTWLWAQAASLLYSRKPNVEQPGPYPFRPVAQAPLRIFNDMVQISTMLNVVWPITLIAASRSLRIKFATEALRSAMASQVFLQLAQLFTEATGQWPLRLAPPIWLSLALFFGAFRLLRAFELFCVSGASALLPRAANRYGLRGVQWALRRHSGREWMAAATRLVSLTGLANTLVEVGVVWPLLELPAFFSPRFVEHPPALHRCWDPAIEAKEE